MATVAQQPRRRGGLRALVILVILVLIVGGALFWLNTAASAAANEDAVLTIFGGNASVAHSGGAFAPATSGTIIQPGDGVKTDQTGRAAIQFPDGTITRLANSTEITLTSAHFNKDGTTHDVSILEHAGRTLNNVQHLVGGASFQVTTQTTTASVRGTEFEVVVNNDGSILIKLFTGKLNFNGLNQVQLNAGQQATATSAGNVTVTGNITPEPKDPFVPERNAEGKVNNDNTTPGSEQTIVGPPLHDGETQTYGYDYAGGGDADFAVAYPGSVMGIQVTLPDGTKSPAGAPVTGNPADVLVLDAPAGHYIITIFGISGLGADGESPTIAMAAKEPCQSTNIDKNGAVRHGFTESELAGAITVQGLSNLEVHIIGTSVSGAIIDGSATFNGAGVTGTGVVFAANGNVGVIAVAATLLGIGIPAQSAANQIAAAVGKDLTNISVGYHVDRLFSCPGVLMIDGHH